MAALATRHAKPDDFFCDKAVEINTFEVTMCIWRQKGLYLKQLLFRFRISKAMANMGRCQTDFLAAETSHLLRDQNRFPRSLRLEERPFYREAEKLFEYSDQEDEKDPLGELARLKYEEMLAG